MQEARLIRDEAARTVGGFADAHHVSAVLRLNGSVEIDRLDDSLCSLVARHESLRGSFTRKGDAYIQRTMEAPSSILTLHRDCDASTLLPLVRSIIADPFEPELDIKLRSSLLAAGTSEHVLVIVIDHLVADGLSLQILLQEFEQIYNGSRELAADEISLGYIDFAAWQRAYLKGQPATRALEYWREQLKTCGCFPAALFLRASEPRDSSVASVVYLDIPSRAFKQIASAAKDARVTTFTFLFASLMQAVRASQHTEDVAVLTPLSDRRFLEMERVVGWFANHVVVSASVSVNDSLPETSRKIMDRLLTADEHYFPRGKLIAELEPDKLREPPDGPHIVFIYEPLDGPESMTPALSGIETTRIELEPEFTGRAVVIVASEVNDVLQISATFQSERVETAQVQRLVTKMGSVLDQFGNDKQKGSVGQWR